MDQIVTIERFIIDQEKVHPQATGIFSRLLEDVALAAKVISRETRRAGLNQILGMAGRVNVQGEQQMKLDVFANETIIRINSYGGRLAAMASEESDDLIHIPPQYACGRYVLLFDPLDGSSNIDSNVSVGTIFAIYRRKSTDGCGVLEDCLQPGRDLAAAGYIIYGPSTMMVYTTGHGVHGFTLDPTLGEFLLSHPDLQFPSRPKYYSVNQSNEHKWSEGVQRYTRWLQGLDHEAEDRQEPLSMRYVGSLVADFHRSLLEGGVFYYPADHQSPRGKLRLAYEAAPLAFIAQQANGYASNGQVPILDLHPAALHERTPLFIGQRELVEKAEWFVEQYDKTRA
jgi:fructose-1,6-bisphosphatase I